MDSSINLVPICSFLDSTLEIIPIALWHLIGNIGPQDINYEYNGQKVYVGYRALIAVWYKYTYITIIYRIYQPKLRWWMTGWLFKLSVLTQPASQQLRKRKISCVENYIPAKYTAVDTKWPSFLRRYFYPTKNSISSIVLQSQLCVWYERYFWNKNIWAWLQLPG